MGLLDLGPYVWDDVSVTFEYGDVTGDVASLHDAMLVVVTVWVSVQRHEDSSGVTAALERDEISDDVTKDDSKSDDISVVDSKSDDVMDVDGISKDVSILDVKSADVTEVETESSLKIGVVSFGSADSLNSET